jgi:hypothetical protein
MTYSENVFIALVIEQTKRMRRAALCGLTGTKILFHIALNKAHSVHSITDILNTKYAFYFLHKFILPAKFFFLRNVEPDVITVHGCAC